MRKFLVMFAITFLASWQTMLAANGHFITDAAYRTKVETAFKQKVNLVGKQFYDQKMLKQQKATADEQGYIISAGGEYRLRRRETITFANGGFVYSYHDDRVGLSDAIFAFNVLYENISKYEYDDKTKILTLYGKIIGDTYENGELKTSDEYNEISLLDVYDFSVKQLLDENC